MLLSNQAGDCVHQNNTNLPPFDKYIRFTDSKITFFAFEPTIQVPSRKHVLRSESSGIFDPVPAT